jgi:hypothetical protein
MGSSADRGSGGGLGDEGKDILRGIGDGTMGRDYNRASVPPPTAEQEHRVYGEKLKDTESE